MYGVLNYLQALIDKSMIIHILDEEKDGTVTFTATDGYDYHGGTNVLKVLGYFSIVGLLRVHCLLGDYHSGLKALAPIDISAPGVYSTVIGCQITTIYYFGFANLMLRRLVLGSNSPLSAKLFLSVHFTSMTDLLVMLMSLYSLCQIRGRHKGVQSGVAVHPQDQAVPPTVSSV